MKPRFIAALATFVVLFFVAAIGTAPISAQQEPTPTPDVLAPTPAPELESRICQLEAAQTQTIKTLELINEQNRHIITGAGALITLLIAVQAIATGIQFRSEKRREDRQARREEERDRVDRVGVEQVAHVMGAVRSTLESHLDINRTSMGQVSQIMDVVRRTLETHLETEERAQKQVEAAQEELKTSLKQFAPLQQFYQSFQNTIKSSRKTIEERASELAQTSRHDFRGMASALSDFAQRVDRFKAEFEALEAGDPRPQFSARVPYIRGVAAHYANQPEIVEEHLKEVVEFGEPEPGEEQRSHNRRVANANYYLGLTESNFGNLQYAIRLFEQANELDLEDRDFLTRVVTAEAYVMLRNFDKAREFTDKVTTRSAEMKKEQGFLRNYHLRLRSRAMLIEANMEIIGREGDWQGQAQQLLERVHAEDPQYYYATATLAQVYHVKGDGDKARELFGEAYATIQQLGHLITVTEARTRVLLLMTAGMCCKHDPERARWAEEHLDQATDLLSSLPRRDNQICTVFSTLSKQNENSDVIYHHIELIRKGRVLL